MHPQLTLDDLDALDFDATRHLHREVREALLDEILAAGRRIVRALPERQVGLLIDGFEEDLVRLVKVNAVRVSCSGVIPTDERGEVPTEDPVAQFRLCFENVKSVLGQLGTSLDRVTNLVVVLRDMSDWGAMNAVYREYFRGPPARAAIGGELNRTYRIEVVGLVAYKLAR